MPSLLPYTGLGPGAAGQPESLTKRGEALTVTEGGHHLRCFNTRVRAWAVGLGQTVSTGHRTESGPAS